MGFAVAASHHERVQVRGGLLKTEFHISVFREMFFLAPAGVDKKSVRHTDHQLPFIRRHAAETEWSASLGKRGRPAFGGKVESVAGKSQRALLGRSRMEIVGELDGAGVADRPGLRELQKSVACIGG